MNSNGSKGRKPTERGKRTESNGRAQQAPKIPQVRSKSFDVAKTSCQKRSASNQRRELAKELIATAQQQLAALSKLKSAQSVKDERHAAKTQTSSGSNSSFTDGRRINNILPNKSTFEYLQQMSDLLRLGREKGKINLKTGNRTPNVSSDCDEKTEPTTRRSKSQGRKSAANNSENSKKRSISASKERQSNNNSHTRESAQCTKNIIQPKPLPKPSAQKNATHLGYMLEITEMLKSSHVKMQAKLTTSDQTSSSKAKTRSSSEDGARSDRKETQNLLGNLTRSSGQQVKQAESKKETVVQTMEQEVKSLQKELELVQAERRGLALQKKLLQCMADTGPSTARGPGPMMVASRDLGCKDADVNQMSLPLQQMYQKPTENLSAVEMQLNSLREQYRKLQEDYNAKVEEVSMVRVEHESAKRDSLQLLEKCREAEARVDDLLERLRAIEMEKSRMAGSKDQMTELEQQLTLAKQRYREGQEELDEVRTTMQDQMIQLEEYRNKYLTAQQTVEEQRRQIDIMELENNRIGEQVNLEIQRVKTQFQEKLQELTPLPDMLKATQLKLQECDQLRQLAERNVEQLLNQSDELKEQNKTLEKELEDLKKSSDSQTAERSNLKYSLTSGEKKIEEIKSENLKLRATVARLEELALSNDRRLDEKTHEVLQLQTQLETLREESARQVSRTKDRCESVRRTLQGQISQLEFQLAQSRAAARTAQKDRDEIRQRMQAQITSLNENFEQAQLRIRSLQSHVNYLKSSYTNIFAPEMSPPMGPKPIDGLTT